MRDKQMFDGVRVSSLATLALAFALAFPFAGCTRPYAAICDKVQECEGGNDMDVDACVAQGDALGNIAAAYSCSEQFSKYADCVEAKGTCDNGHFKFACDDERKALESCVEAASAIDDNLF